ncbi:STAS domain-containing protein [Aneurinibacillus sp. Ricciae_BoGa-3]|uniref:STAS domain-containing protein n=1 Tax=Aneurinibacillus sp. Ricciae_BoGa-3 TaxID=3022697 RepID=UPI00233FDA97|nr:STAS domain-containing protein [Aneurinibacillus sp. Ricciae_BoGa-3]WCK54016.1 STAS domain-containing protein [Aneurinibacillus sp. Ricciae_BoGa-3]
MSPISKVAKYFIEHAQSLAAEIVETIIDRMKLEPVLLEGEKEQAVNVYAEFLGFLGRSFASKEVEAPEGLVTWSKKNGEQEASCRGKISEIIMRYPATRMVFAEYVMKVSILYGLTIEEVVFINTRINYLLDISINETVLAFERLKDKIIKETQDEINELSAPVVPIEDGIAVLPLIGSIDSYRANYIVEKVIPKITELSVTCLVIDFSGIQIIDTAVANHVFKIHSVLRLLGINAIVTGIRPELAQTVVGAGIDFSTIEVYANVQQALEEIKAKS